MARAPCAPGAAPHEGFAHQARQCLPQLYRIARRLTLQQADAEDLVHDTYLKALRAADRVRLDSAEDCRAWLTRILVNTYRDQHRQRLRSPVLSAAGNGIGELIDLRLASCSSCRAELELIAEVEARMRDAFASNTPSDALYQRVDAILIRDHELEAPPSALRAVGEAPLLQ